LQSDLRFRTQASRGCRVRAPFVKLLLESERASRPAIPVDSSPSCDRIHPGQERAAGTISMTRFVDAHPAVLHEVLRPRPVVNLPLEEADQAWRQAVNQLVDRSEIRSLIALHERSQKPFGARIVLLLRRLLDRPRSRRRVRTVCHHTGFDGRPSPCFSCRVALRLPAAVRRRVLLQASPAFVQ
jgi:hypothetical protein